MRGTNSGRWSVASGQRNRHRYSLSADHCPLPTDHWVSMSIHPTAIVDSKSKVHSSCEIGPYCVIGPGVELGEGCGLASHVAIEGPTTIGSDNHFSPFTSIGLGPQDIGRS